MSQRITSINELRALDPEALSSDYGDYRERPISGWRVVNNLYFVGVGPEGEEITPITDGWTSCPRGQGIFPVMGTVENLLRVLHR